MGNEWNINLGGGAYSQWVLPAAKYKATFVEATLIQIRRGEKFCDPKKGHSPEDLLDKIRFSFLPTNEKLLSQCPPEKTPEITTLMTPSFGKLAKLPAFLAGLSEDGQVPKFKTGEDLHTWIKSHYGNLYAVTVKPNETGTRNTIVQVSFLEKGKDLPPIVAPQAKQEALEIPEDDIPF